jgi:hypothetical protein
MTKKNRRSSSSRRRISDIELTMLMEIKVIEWILKIVSAEKYSLNVLLFSTLTTILRIMT